MQKIIIDTDIGDDIDDAFAIALALELEDVEVIGITTVFRNAKARAKQVVELLKSVGKDNIEVCAGADNPLISTPQNFKKEFYDDNGKYLPCQYDTSYETNRISDKNAIDFIIESANKYNGELVLAPIGALTNIALALRTDNDLCKKIKKIVLMGGYDSYAIPEWNIMCDSEAA
ncbi:MAG: nucleoside hydrolase, partial [Clostridia bacterium]